MSCKSRLSVSCFTILVICFVQISAAEDEETSRPRARDLGLKLGILKPGENNAITDVDGIKVGHFTYVVGNVFHTGITAVVPHGGNLFHEKVPAAIYVGNGFGKLAGSTQVNELGEIETPILLTGTLSVPRVADGLITYMLNLPEMDSIYSINPVVGETNDGYLSDIRSRPFTSDHVQKVIESAKGGPVQLGAVGAGAGTVCFGFKGGIGSASRKLPEELGGWTVGVLVQSNFGGVLTINGKNVGKELGKYPYKRYLEGDHDGSIMIVIATDAPLQYRNLKRLAFRSFLGIARTGGYASNGSGDYAIAFSTHEELRIRRSKDPNLNTRPILDNDGMSILFLAVVEATEEAIIDSLFTAKTTEGFRGSVEQLPVDKVLEIIGLQK